MCQQVKTYAERLMEAQEFVSLVKRMRDAQAKYETLNVQRQYVNEASREDFDRLSEAAYEAFVLENEVDKHIDNYEEGRLD